jgi:hypothetical protein
MKSLDKKKTGFRKMTADDLRRGIDLSKTISGFRVIETKSDKPMKSLDKNKTKELEWAEEYRKLLKEYQVNAEDWDCFPDLGVKFINGLLTQQRTELLEEIKKIVPKWIDNPLGEVNSYTVGRRDERLEIREKLLNLLNKKDE